MLQPVANVTSLAGVADVSFSLAPGEHAVINLRVACAAASNTACFDPQNGTQMVLAKQASDCTVSSLSDIDLPKCEQPETRFDVIDHIAPAITFSPAAPANIVQGTSPAGAQVSWSATVSDAGDVLLGETPTASCSFVLGGNTITGTSGTNLFPYGTTSITCVAADSIGNKASTTFTIKVVDTEAPVVTVVTVPGGVTVPASVTLQATSPAGAVYTFSASATDNVDGTLTPSCTPSAARRSRWAPPR